VEVPPPDRMPTNGSVDDPASSSRWVTLCVLSLCVVVIGIDNTVLNVALPTIVRKLGATGSDLQWIVDAYTIVFACLLLTAGSLGDRYGRKYALRFGLIWFGSFSAFAALASSPGMLIVTRGLMGLGAAFIYPTTLSIITNTFHVPSERARAIGIWAGVAGIGISIGPLLGGLLVETFGWPSVFLINVPVCVVAVLLAHWYVPNSSSPEESPLDPVGAVLSIFALVAVLFAIIEAPEHGWTSGGVVGSFTAGAILLGAFIWWERKNPRPMLDVRIFKNPRFSAASATMTLTQFAMFGSTFLLTQYFQFRLGYSPLESGLMLMPVAIGLMVGAPNAPKLVHRFGTTRVVVTGLCAVSVATAFYASDTLMSSFTTGFAIRLLYGLGMGFTAAPVTESIMGSLPRARAGVGSAINDTTRQTGGALGVAVLGSIFAFRYHHVIDATAGVPATVLHHARDSIGRSLQVAQTLGGTAGANLQHAAQQAFVSSMRITFGVAALVVLFAAVTAAKFLPPRSGEIGAETTPDETAQSLIVGVERSGDL
jgi:EmrB/QacA subfamily drug resistance transporter